MGCVTPGSPCDDPALCQEANDSCGCPEPVVTAEGCRFLAVTPKPGTTPVALLLTGIDLGVSCVSRYVRADGRVSPTPVFQLPDEWGTVHVFGQEVRPSTTYALQTECDTGKGFGFSTPGIGTTWQWADTDNSGGQIQIDDVVRIADGFSNVFLLGVTFYNVELWGPGPFDVRPDLIINIIDVVQALSAFSALPYPDPPPCE